MVRGVLVLAVAGVLATTLVGSGNAAVPGVQQPCIESGTEAEINAALDGAGAKAVLCAGAEFTLHDSVTLTAPDQEVSTEGLPTDASRATLTIANPDLTMAINGGGKNGAVVRNIQVDGNRPELGHLEGEALIRMGGYGSDQDAAGSNQTLRNVVARDTRSWSTVQFHEGTVTDDVPLCQNGTIVDNTIGPAGHAEPGGTWGDGISLACGNTVVRGNTIVDATDGGIVVFGAPGSTIEENTIVANNRVLLGGVNMVDFDPVNGNYEGTVVRNNTIDARGALIKVGIAMGWQVWGCGTGTNHGGTVTGNTLTGDHFGYGFAVNGVRDWTVLDNVDESTHVGTPGEGCGGLPSEPAGFQVQAAESSDLQPEFTDAKLDYVLGLTEP